MNKLRIKSAGRRSTSSNNCGLEQPLEPYRRLPFSPLPVHRPPRCPPSSKMQARKVAARRVENHFELEHNQYKARENHHSSIFKVKAKRQKVVRLSSNEAFWVEKLEPRARNIRELNEHYLMDVREELQRRINWFQTETEWNKEEKVINQYNIIYEYQQCSLPLNHLL